MAYSCVRVTFEIGHEASLRAKKTPEGFTHDWEVFVRGADGTDIVHFVEKVIFYLHDSFPRPKRVVKEPPFLVKESGYAGFTLPIEICFKNKDDPKNVVYDYDLHLQSGGPPINRYIRHKYYFTNPSEELRRRLIKGGGVGVGSEGGPIEKSLPEDQVINNNQSPSVGKPKSGGELSKKHKEYKLEEQLRLNNSNTHLGVHPQKSGKVSPEVKRIPSPLPKPTKPVEKLEKSSGSKDSSSKERDKSKDKTSSKHHSSPKSIKEDNFIEKPSSGDSKKKKEKKSKDEKEAKRHENKHSDKADKGEKIEKTEKVSKSEKPSKDRDAGSSKKLLSSLSSSSSLLKEQVIKSAEKPKEKEREKHSGDKERDKEKQKHKHKKKERNRKEDEKDKSSSKKSKSQDKEKTKRPPSPPVQVYTSPISFVSSQPEVSQEKVSKFRNSTDSEVSPEENTVTPTINSTSNRKKDKSKSEQTVLVDENNKKESGKKRKRKSTKGIEEQPNKKAAIAEDNIFTEEYVSELKELQHKIMTLEDTSELQKLVQVITETGQYEITSKTFDFDLCMLDKATIKRLQEFFSSPTV